jgi:glycosyltransferase involved in cell wall biosynthesis
MKYDISIPIPTIRIENLSNLYDSIDKSFTEGSWEIIFVSPYPLSDDLLCKDNVKYIQDWGCPTRCRQMGLVHSEGEWICYAADDVLFFPNSLDVAYQQLQSVDYKTAVLGKYTEGNRDNPLMLTDDYYRMDFHDAFKDIQPSLSKSYYLFMSGLVSTKLVKEVGGWDCQFQTCAMSCMDLSMRLQNYGLKILTTNEPLFHASHMPNTTGDHAPIHYAQIIDDQPLFNQLYTSDNPEKRIKIEIDNWKNCPSKWERRFGR